MKDDLILVPFLPTFLKLAFFSLLVGAGLSFVNVSAEDILGSVGLSPMQLWIYLHLFIDWAIPNIILGAFIVVPVWVLLYLFRPPQ